MRSADIAARASIRVKAAFSAAAPSERGKPFRNRQETTLLKIAGKGCAGLRGGVTASARVTSGGRRKKTITAVTANPASSQGLGLRHKACSEKGPRQDGRCEMRYAPSFGPGGKG